MAFEARFSSNYLQIIVNFGIDIEIPNFTKDDSIKSKELC
jgi:hypothetical protein